MSRILQRMGEKHATATTQPDRPPWAQRSRARLRWYLAVATALLLGAAFFRLWDLGATPPGMHPEELINAQLSDRVRQGDLAVIYDEVEPAREGLFYVLLAASSAVTGRGLILWRLPSVWLSLLSLAVTAQVMRRLFGVRVALMALGLTAVAFWAVWMGRTVQHVTLMPLVTSAGMYLLSRAFQAREHTRASLWFTAGGLLLGLAQYVHATAWTLLVLFLAYIVYRRVVDRKEVRRHQANIIYTLILTATVCLPLAIFLMINPGVRQPVPLAEQAGLITEIPERLATSLAGLVLRGDMLPYHNLPGRPVLGPVIGALMVVGIGVALARWRRAPYGLALLWLAIGLLPAAFLPHKPNFEFMAVILPVVFVFPAIGLHALFQVMRERLGGRLRQIAVTAIGSLVAVVIATNAAWTFRDFFLVWPTLGDVRLSYQADLGVLAHYLDTSDDPTPISICSTPVDRAEDPFALTNAELLSYLMHRHDLPIRYFDCTQSLVLADGGESQRLIFPRSHYYTHLPGPLLAWMRYAHDERVPGIRPDVLMRFEAPDQVADTAGAFMTTALAAWPPEARAEGLAQLPLSFGYNVAFLGYEIGSETIFPGEWVELITYWRMDGPPPPTLTVFAHLLGNPVVIVAQHDSLGVAINTLRVRDVFIQHSLIQTPGGLAEGPYIPSVGLYFDSPDQRVPAFEDGRAIADRLFLRSVNVRR